MVLAQSVLWLKIITGGQKEKTYRSLNGAAHWEENICCCLHFDKKYKLEKVSQIFPWSASSWSFKNFSKNRLLQWIYWAAAHRKMLKMAHSMKRCQCQQPPWHYKPIQGHPLSETTGHENHIRNLWRLVTGINNGVFHE